MAKIISASIDLTKIDKSKILKTDKNGQPFKNGAQYLNLQIVLNDNTDDYGNDCAIRLNQSKEERESGIKAVYLGNGKTVWSSEPAVENIPVHNAEVVTETESSDGLPF